MSRFTIKHASGVINKAKAKTLTGAKREASQEMTHGGGSVSVTDRETGEVWQREFWQNLNRFGWGPWKRV